MAARTGGPLGVESGRLMVDTGASFSTVSIRLLEAIGVSVAGAVRVQTVVTASGLERVPLVRVDSLESLGSIRRPHLVLAHDVPAVPQVDGLLGLDFFRGARLTIDFRTGRIELD